MTLITLNNIIRTSIESSYGHEVAELRLQYTPEDKEVLTEFLDAKEEFYQKTETTRTELEDSIICKLHAGMIPKQAGISGWLLNCMDFTFCRSGGSYPIASQPPTMHL